MVLENQEKRRRNSCTEKESGVTRTCLKNFRGAMCQAVLGCIGADRKDKMIFDKCLLRSTKFFITCSSRGLNLQNFANSVELVSKTRRNMTNKLVNS